MEAGWFQDWHSSEGDHLLGAATCPGSWHSEGAHAPISLLTLVEEHGPPARSVEKTAYRSVPSTLC